MRLVAAFVLLGLSAALHALPPSAALDLSVSGAFNLITWDDAVLEDSSVGGAVAIGGNGRLRHYAVGAKLGASDPWVPALVVRGDLKAREAVVKNGSTYIGGAFSGPGYPLTQGAATTSARLGREVPFNFLTARATLEAKSRQYGALPPNGSLVPVDTTLMLTATDPALNIFSIDAAVLAAARALMIDVPVGARVLVNVTGRRIDFSNKGIGGASAPDTLFNFPEATQLSITRVHIPGTILAPFARVSFSSGQLTGQMIAHSFSGGGTFNRSLFNNDRPPDSGVAGVLGGAAGGVDPGSPVPDIAGTGVLTLLGLGLLATAGFWRKR